MANPRVQEVISKLDDLSNFRQKSLYHTQVPTGKFYKMIEGSYKVLPSRQQIFNIQKGKNRNWWMISNAWQTLEVKNKNNVTLWQEWLNCSWTAQCRNRNSFTLTKSFNNISNCSKTNNTGSSRKTEINTPGKHKTKMDERGPSLPEYYWNSCFRFWLWHW